ncbi:hypothetical protein NQ314_021285 [Rhamnusium bicolor]|uniref:Gustatory receptor n=1 Tax=Rhamnusium bicolor TaxID=1586634 RepID=A0AAV8WIS4_9CUCU|nr:hypothetical protein NQ314_021285 [Rhamnusium bicolor]
MEIFTVVIVMSCDDVDKNAKKITTTCYILQEGRIESSLRTELICLAEYTKELTPKFTAAGFFKIDQSTLATLFSAIITYLIICIQFNMAL